MLEFKAFQISCIRMQDAAQTISIRSLEMIYFQINDLLV